MIEKIIRGNPETTLEEKVLDKLEEIIDTVNELFEAHPKIQRHVDMNSLIGPGSNNYGKNFRPTEGQIDQLAADIKKIKEEKDDE